MQTRFWIHNGWNIWCGPAIQKLPNLTDIIHAKSHRQAPEKLTFDVENRIIQRVSAPYGAHRISEES